MPIRKSATALTDEERDSFLAAVLSMKATIANPGDPQQQQISVYDQFEAIHIGCLSVTVPGGGTAARKPDTLPRGLKPNEQERRDAGPTAAKAVDPAVAKKVAELEAMQTWFKAPDPDEHDETLDAAEQKTRIQIVWDRIYTAAKDENHFKSQELIVAYHQGKPTVYAEVTNVAELNADDLPALAAALKDSLAIDPETGKPRLFFSDGEQVEESG